MSISGAVRGSCIRLILRWLLVRSMLCELSVLILLVSILTGRTISFSVRRFRVARLIRVRARDCLR